MGIEKNIFNMKLFVALLVAAGAQKFDPCQKSCGAEFRKCSRSAQVKKLNSDFTSCLSESVECFSHCPRPKREDDCFFCYSDVWKCQMQCHREAEKLSGLYQSNAPLRPLQVQCIICRRVCVKPW